MSRARRLRPTTLVLLLSLVVSLASLTLVNSRGAFSDSTDNPGNSFASLSCFKPAQPGSVQSGTATSSANGTLSVSITPVDAAMSFLVFSSRHDSNRPVGSHIRGRLNAAGNAVEFVRVTNEAVPVSISIQWYVVEYSCGIRVQRGEVAQGSTTINVPITPVGSTSAAFVTWSKSPVSTDGTWNSDDPVVGELTSPSNLQFRVNSANLSHVIAWQVIEFIDPADVNVQRGATSLLGTATLTTVTLGTPVDVSKTFILVDYRTAGSGADIGARMLRAELTNSTTITIDRSISGTPDDITEISWQAVELQDGSSVQRGSEPFLAGTASATVGISTVDVTKAYAFGSVQAGSGQNMGRSPYAVDDVIGVGSFTAALTGSQLTLTRDNTDADADVGWFVVHWGTSGPSVSGLSPSSGPPAGGTSVVISGSGFTGATAVDFGATPATGFTVDSDSQITATSPAGSGTVDVQVTTPSGTSANTGADDFTYTNTYYVRTDGADTNSGLSNTAGGAWLTIQKAASTMVAGDTVRVQPGTYPETVTPLNAGTAANQITYLADGAAVVDGGNVRCKAFEVGTGYVVIDGFEITNQPDCGGADSAININNANNVTVRNNIIHDTGRDAVYFAGTSANGLVENNLIYNIDDDGSTPTGGGGHTFRNNTFAGTIGGWTLENGAASNLFENNIFWTSAIQNTSLGTFNYNDYNGGVLPGTGNISSDPIFVNAAAADYHLSHIAAGQGSNSPAIDAGSDTATNLGLDTKTTRTDNVTDTSTVDLGYHYWVPPSAALTGTLVPSALEADIVTGGDTLVITLSNDTWDSTVGADNAITTALINGIDSNLGEATGWDAVVRDFLTFNEVTRTSATVVTITLPAFGSYDVTADETITVIVPASAVASAGAITATPTFDIIAASAGIVQVQKATGNAGGAASSVTATYGAAPTQDNLLVLVHHYRDVGTVTLPAGWTQAVAQQANGSIITIAYKIAGAAEGTGVTVSVSVADHQTLTIFEYSGIDTVSPLDLTASNFNTSIATISCSTGTTATTSVADELLIAGVGLNGLSGGWGNTWTNGFTQQSTVASGGGGDSNKSASSTADRIVTATGTFETTESWTNGRRCQTAIATFKAAP